MYQVTSCNFRNSWLYIRSLYIKTWLPIKGPIHFYILLCKIPKKRGEMPVCLILAQVNLQARGPGFGGKAPWPSEITAWLEKAPGFDKEIDALSPAAFPRIGGTLWQRLGYWGQVLKVCGSVGWGWQWGTACGTPAGLRSECTLPPAPRAAKSWRKSAGGPRAVLDPERDPGLAAWLRPAPTAPSPRVGARSRDRGLCSGSYLGRAPPALGPPPSGGPAKTRPGPGGGARKRRGRRRRERRGSTRRWETSTAASASAASHVGFLPGHRRPGPGPGRCRHSGPRPEGPPVQAQAQNHQHLRPAALTPRPGPAHSPSLPPASEPGPGPALSPAPASPKPRL